jgi:GPH family glycoside/pentoside/hexuronide:cation symporter
MSSTALSRDRVRLSIRLCYGAGAVAEGVVTTAFNVFLLFYYNQVLGLPGTLSDNLHSRWGRRHPFLYASVLPTATCFFLVFHPPSGLSHGQLFAWLLTFAVGVRVSMTLYVIPSDSLMPEITYKYDERTSLVGIRFLFGWLGGLTIAQMGYLLFFAPSDRFPDGRLDAAAYGAFATAGVALIVAAILTCALGTHRLIPALRAPSSSGRFSPARLAREVKQVLANRSYLALLVGTLFAATAQGFNDVMGLYMGTYFWGFSTAELAILLYAYAGATVLAVTFARPVTERFDKRSSLMGLVTFAIAFGPLPVFLRLLGLMPQNGTRILLSLIFAHALCIVTVVIAISIIFASMIGDLVDENELATGERQEGVFMAAIAFVGKATSGVGGFLAGVALDLIDFPVGKVSGTVSAMKVARLGLAVGPGLMALYVLSAVCFSRYRLTRERHAEIVAELAERRRGSAESAPGGSAAAGVASLDPGGARD